MKILKITVLVQVYNSITQTKKSTTSEGEKKRWKKQLDIFFELESPGDHIGQPNLQKTRIFLVFAILAMCS